MEAGMMAGLALAAGALTPRPVLAQQVDWVAAKAAFETGADGDEKPDERAEMIGCAAFWSQWANAANAGRVPAEAGRTVSPLLVVPDAGMLAFGWLLASIQHEGNEDTAALEAEVEAVMAEVEPLAREKITAALAGDRAALRGVMGVLGKCQMPPE
jgi:hypothetical protein